MTGLLPDTIREAVQSRGDYPASESFGLVTLVVLGVVLIEREILRLVRASPARMAALFAAAVPLTVAVALTIGVRIADLFP